ncbi:T9SS type A sorting domain-containing protein [Flavobacterium sp. 3HN19-14]|uniref:T9SS type A sorting domain-containing protein n=1 Tax=Flavobacterium sp. 3HN19-14 TaxID=3448133 RepID=UPI003EE39586
MPKNYFYIILLVFCFFTVGAQAQEKPSQPAATELSFYPNPVSNGKIYITSKTSLEKEIAIFDVLGKLVFEDKTASKELNISKLSPGVYIIKIKEGETTATRKLIVK